MAENSEQKINKQLSAINESFVRTLPRKNGQVIRAINRSRLTVADILAKYENAEGKIPRNKINAVITDVQAIQGEMYRNIRDELRLILRDSAEYSTKSVLEAVVAILGISTIINFAGLSTVVSETEALLFSALIGTSILDFVIAIVESSFNRKGDDGKRLNDRLRELTKLLTNEITVTLRESIRKGEGTTEALRKIQRKFNEADWRLETLVETESLFALRQSIATFAEDSGLVKAIRIVDHPHGDPGVHERHKCHIYANRDSHGLGKGVYPVSTRKIRNPHPRCRSTLLLVLADELN